VQPAAAPRPTISEAVDGASPGTRNVLPLGDNVCVTLSPAKTDWNSFARATASQKWRKQSAAMGRDMTQAIIEAAGVAPGMRVLDVACGTGEPAISLAMLLRDSGEVTGVDISTAPLKIAEQRAVERELTNTRFQQADVHSLPFDDNSFDRVTSRLGVMFFTDLPRALREIHRVLKPQGTATLLAWGAAEQQPYFQATIGTILRVLPASMPDSADKMFAFGEADVLAQALRRAEFARVEEQFVTVPWTWPGTPEEVWEYFQDVAVPFAPLFQSIPRERRGEIDHAVLREIARYYDGAEIKFTATANITTAVK
jgi:ubiquinone/menaquinone biosynthesis C-methylase UbiE